MSSADLSRPERHPIGFPVHSLLGVSTGSKATGRLVLLVAAVFNLSMGSVLTAGTPLRLDLAQQHFSDSSTQVSADQVVLLDAPAISPASPLHPIWQNSDLQSIFSSVRSDGAALISGIFNPANLVFAEVGESAAKPKANKVVVLHNIKLDTSSWPLVGKPDAEKVFVELFDYGCSHCQQTHAAIKGARKMYGDRLAVMCLPVPMDSKCNPTVTSPNSSKIDACGLAKLTIAVWAVDRTKFSDFHDYLFESQPTYEMARARALTIVDRDKLNAMLASSIPSDFINKHVQIYQRAGSGTIPKLMFPQTTIVGAVNSTSELNSLIERHLR